jgi:hypothetical protein
MKKLFLIQILMVFAMEGIAQETHFDFSVTSATGYDLYYRIVDAASQIVEVTYPCQHDDNYWWGYIKPEGKLVLPDTVTYNGISYTLVAIDDHTFYGCSDLRGELELPQTIATIGASAFKGCANLNGKLVLPISMTRIEDEAFSGCSSFTGRIEIPDSVQYIGRQAFLDCSGFRGMMMLPASLTFIGEQAFKGCSSINSMSVKSTTVPTTAANAFDNIPSWISVNVPYNMLEAYKNASGWSRFASQTVEKSIWTGNAEAWTQGSGTANDPYLIESAENLAWLAKSVNEKQDVDTVSGVSPGGAQWIAYIYNDVYAYQNEYFRLVIDIDLQKGQGLYWEPIGSVHDLSTPDFYGNNRCFTYFSAHFEGNGHEISNYIMYDDYWPKEEVNGTYRGLFGIISDGSIYNLTISDLKINSQKTSKIIGGVTGRAINSTLSNCHTSGLIKSGGGSYPVNTVGGIVGFAENCLIDNCSVSTTIDACSRTYNQAGAVGGIVGTMINDPQFEGKSKITHCKFNGSMVNLMYCAGGIVGLCDGASANAGIVTIENCYSKGAMVRYANDQGNVVLTTRLGGIVGKVADIDTLFILNCYSNDTITGNSSTASNVYSYAGGIIANADAVATLYIKNCYHVGPISSKNKGGILAQNTNMTLVRNCYFEAGCVPDDGFGVPLSNDYMKTEAFVNQLNNGSTVFRMDTEPFENDGYPIFGTDGLIFVGAEWYYEIQGDDGTITYQHLQCVGDTTINEERPKIIIRSNTHYDRENQTEVTHEYVYEKNGVVYWWNKTLGRFTVLYDFSAEVGDEWTIEVGDETITTKVFASELQHINGIPYKKLTVADSNDVFSGTLLSSIGHQTSFFPERLMTQDKNYRVDGLRCYWMDDVLIYKLGDEDCDAVYAELHQGIDEKTDETAFAVYPNPASSVLFVETRRATSLPDQTYRITNLTGQTVLSGCINTETQQIDIKELPSGMYFITVGGQTVKFVVK